MSTDTEQSPVDAPAGGHILIPTDNQTPSPYAHVREAAIAIARERKLPVIFYDRTDESFFLSPYPSGPMTGDVEGPDGSELLVAGQLDRMGRAYLAHQIEAAARLGVEAKAWLPLRPGAAGMADAVERFDVGVVALPADVAEPTLIDRVRGNSLTAFRSRIDTPILLVHDSGQTRIDASTAETTAV